MFSPPVSAIGSLLTLGNFGRWDYSKARLSRFALGVLTGHRRDLKIPKQLLVSLQIRVFFFRESLRSVSTFPHAKQRVVLANGKAPEDFLREP
jgi:hypothetical protein